MPPKKKVAAKPTETETVLESPAQTALAAPSGNPTEVFTLLQEAVAGNAAAINEHVPQLLELVHTAERPDTPLLLRVRFLEFVSRVVADLRDSSALQKIVTSLVHVIGGDDNTPQLLTAALNSFVGLGPVSMMDKKWEYLSCEGSDILMQVMLDKEAFPEPARRAAATALDALVSTAFKSVIKKLVHWISDEREDDDPEQLQRERQLAVTRLTRMVTSATYRAHWTEELQSEVLDLIQRVLGTVDAREFTQLVRIVSHLPICKERHGVPLLELFLSKYDLNSERHLESVTIIGRYVKEGAEFDLLPYLEKSKLLAKPLGSDAHAVLLSRLVLLATRVATSDNAELLFEYVFGQLSALVGTDEALPDNLSVVEALLLAATNIARKSRPRCCTSSTRTP
ncbi:hypothetical protein STCU_06564 [Strigomonas culicis]|uniref:Uncharacterized protein n=1 Tax=Strigomonas culicis TaxID=28005 RepID=S9UAB6_9TRYP|nr:hypothetical protein STCU_06564 [Strigomonas culicis]|eukprot:EPY25679.1 hypothetical protein STCU_06564 [Strigomonas culicis]